MGGGVLLIFEVLGPVKGDGFFVVVREGVGGGVDAGYDLFGENSLHKYVYGATWDCLIPQTL